LFLLVDLALHPELGLAELLFASIKQTYRSAEGMWYLFLLFTELFLLQTYTLSSKFLGKQGAVTEKT
jgi:hypothetical protein